MHVHLAADSLLGDSEAKPILTRALQLMGQVIEEGRNSVRGLRSSFNGSLDLEEAFSRIQREVYPQEGGEDEVRFRVIADGERKLLNPHLRDEVYRIGREALFNAFRHARAKTIEIEVRYSSSQLRLLVRDDGCGVDPQVISSGREGHFGLAGMRERAKRIGGQLNVFSSVTSGTEVELSVPGHLAFCDQLGRKSGWFGRRQRPRRTAMPTTNDRNGDNK
jgi:signal transduction histidine kinase